MTHAHHRRLAHRIARGGTALSAAMFVLTGVALLTVTSGPASAATSAGAVTVITPVGDGPGAGAPLTTGGSSTPFGLKLPASAACTGDSSNDGYRVQTFLVPSDVDPASLQFGPEGPVPFAYGTYATFRQPLYDVGGSPVVEKQTAAASPAPGPGPIVNLPAFSFGVFTPGDLPPGTYVVGVACTKGGASSTQLDRYWSTLLTIVEATSDQPAGLTWSIATPSPASTTTTAAPSSTTTAAPTTTTAVRQATTATTLGSTASSTTVAAEESARPESSSAASTGSGPTTGRASVLGETVTLPVTGASTTALVVWALLLLVFGRAAMLLGRVPAVRIVDAP